VRRGDDNMPPVCQYTRANTRSCAAALLPTSPQPPEELLKRSKRIHTCEKL
jgi:hypothetical protein